MRHIVTLSSSRVSALVLRLLFVAAFLTGVSTLLTAQAAPAGAGSALSLPEHGVTVQLPAGWAHHQNANVHELLNLSPQKEAHMTAADRENAAKIRVNELQRRTHSEAVDRLALVAHEYKTRPTFLTIDGWPALQRQVLVVKPQRGQEEDSVAKPINEQRPMLILVTTAVAVGNKVFRLDGTIPAESQAAIALAQQMKDIGAQLRFQSSGNAAATAQELQKLQNYSTAPAAGTASPISTSVGTSAPAAPGIAYYNTQLQDEAEIAVSASGKNIVIGGQGNGVSSQDGGQTFSATFGFPKSACGDSSVAYGRSGNFYHGTIGTTNKSCDSQVVDVSTDGGKTFPNANASNVFVCGPGGSGPNCAFVGTANPNGVPDQEHIAADRFNAGPAPTSGDQVYFVWRGSGGYGISCSSDSGKTWSAVAFKGDGSPDFARPVVGQDGLVYVVYLNGNNIEMDRYTSCANGLTQQEQGAVAATTNGGVDCINLAGVDRCGGINGTGQNDMRSHTVAVDDTLANHIYVAFADNNVSDQGTNEDIFVADSYSHGDNGTWSTPIRVNNGIPAHRFLPWACAVGGTAYVSWYDRRNATPSTNDVTDYFASSAAPDVFGNLAPGSDFQINAGGTGDPQCASGWGSKGGATASANYSESCFVQPQLAGACGTASPLKAGDTGTACDFSGTDATACGTGPNGAETCQVGRGGPKYGDYSGSACAAGRLYNVWSSATSQPGANKAASGINLFFAEKLVCCDAQIQVPGPVSLSACSGTTATTTVNICNTGKADLQVNSITSSNAEITVAQPTSGFPLTISPDSCFPAQVSLSPGATTGTVSGTLTISSNDTVNPSATVQVNGDSPAPSINATIVNSGNFGSVCPAGQSNLVLQITNQSQCNLVVSSITSSNSGLFLPPTTASMPLTLTADATVDLPISFQPPVSQSCSDTTALTGTITVVSNDPTAAGVLSMPVQGTVPCPHINSTFVNSGSYGNVCAGTHEDLNLQLLNTGQCNLNISSITSSNSSGFILPAGTTFPLVLSADANVSVPVRFMPSGVCSNTVPQTSTITVNSNDPGGALTQAVSGIEGCPKLVLSPQNLTGPFAYPATVSDPTGTLGCYTDRQITVANAGICPLTITSLTTANGTDGKGLPLTGSPLEFSVINPTVPITVGVGAAPVPVTIRFKPLILTDQNPMAPDQQTGTLSIVSNDPVAGDNTAGLCGEPTYHSGARILVVDSNSNPVSSVAKITLSSKGLTPGFSQTLMPAHIMAGSACGNPIQFHLDNETLKPAGTTGNNPLASYVLSAKNGNTQANMSFTLGQCQMQQIILQVK